MPNATAKSQQEFNAAIGIIEHALQIELGVESKVLKCATYIPDKSRLGLGPDPSIKRIDQVNGALLARGNACGGEFETILGPYAVAAEPGRKRLSEAIKLAGAQVAYEHVVPELLQGVPSDPEAQGARAVVVLWASARNRWR